MDGTVLGTEKDDIIDGGYRGDPEGDRVDAADAVAPGAGPDDDVVLGREGNDRVSAGAGNDAVFGGTEDDRLSGDDGDDTLDGGPGRDLLRGEAGNDLLIGGEGDDTLKGGSGDDTLIGGAGSDWLGGGADRDLLVAGPGDFADGGVEGDDHDVLDLRGLGPYRIEITGRDLNGNGVNGLVVFLDADGNPTGEPLRFEEIEGFLEDGGPDGTVEGTDGGDLIDGSYTGDPEGDRVDNNDALLPGSAGNDDLIFGFGGDDTILAGDGNDVVFGGAGNDSVDGGPGDDTLHGDEGDDSLLGGTGRDTIFGGDGDDVIDSSDRGVGLFDNPYPPLPADPFPLDDRDTVFGGAGNDRIRTGDDRDTIFGGAGDDRIDAGIDDDVIDGGDGSDTIVGSEGNDSILGGAGDDLIYGGLSPDFPDSLNIPDDGSDGGPDLVPDNGRDRIDAGAGNDTVFGLDDNDTILGRDGDDRLDGGIDDDLLFGGAGNDTIIGGQGNDTLFGGADRDLFLGGNGGDFVDGGGTGDDFDTLDLTGTRFTSITYTSPDRENGFVTFEDGRVLEFREIERVIPCFTPGTAIATPRGERLIEELRVGDRIITRDNGIQEIRWIGAKEIPGRTLALAPHLRPVLVRAGALGNGLPERDMMLSPNHRVLLANERTELYFEESEVLAAVKHLVGTPGIQSVTPLAVTYIHILFDRHEVVLSNGAWTESFQPGSHSLKGLGAEQRNEILELFPELGTTEGIAAYQAARKSLKRHEAQLLVR